MDVRISGQGLHTLNDVYVHDNFEATKLSEDEAAHVILFVVDHISCRTACTTTSLATLPGAVPAGDRATSCCEQSCGTWCIDRG